VFIRKYFQGQNYKEVVFPGRAVSRPCSGSSFSERWWAAAAQKYASCREYTGFFDRKVRDVIGIHFHEKGEHLWTDSIQQDAAGLASGRRWVASLP
jgi:hypothetical protein